MLCSEDDLFAEFELEAAFEEGLEDYEEQIAAENTVLALLLAAEDEDGNAQRRARRELRAVFRRIELDERIAGTRLPLDELRN